jgi:hypothetical protein
MRSFIFCNYLKISLGREMVGGMWHAWEMRENCTRLFEVKPEGKRPLGRPRRRWKDGIRMNLRDIGWEDVEWVQLAQNRGRWGAVVKAVMNLRVMAPRN